MICGILYVVYDWMQGDFINYVQILNISGLCQCDVGFVGTKCECSANHDINQNATELSKQCEQDGYICEFTIYLIYSKTISFLLGNGRGECDCGLCKCNEKHIKGKYCQCDDTSCERNGLGLLCSGPNHGTCDCSVCQCKDGWEVS
jgi:integrin beta 1